MARRIYSRLRISGMLLAETPLHVGGYGDSSDTDLPLAKNGKGEWYVPGTSIAGVLRNWCERNFGEPISGTTSIVDDLFGPSRRPGVEKGHASFVLVEDATIDQGDRVLPEIRDGVGIDRFYGTAADKAKFDRAVLPRGTKLNFAMTVEIEARKDPDQNGKTQEEKRGETAEEFESRDKKIRAVIGTLLAALTKSKVRFGAGRTRGLGRTKLMGKRNLDGEHEDEPAVTELNFLGFDNILDLVENNGLVVSIADLKGAAISGNFSPQLELNVTWKPRLPVMVKAGYDGIGVDILPLVSQVDQNKVALVLPGSSIKGAMRSHAERIIRTLLDGEEKEPRFDTKGRRDFHDQVDVPLVSEIFGAKNKSADIASNAKEHLGLGALSIDDCYAIGTMDRDRWRKVETAGTDNEKSSDDWELTQRLGALSNANFRINHHVAIDRWTGGASEGALYSTLTPVPADDAWEAMRLTLDFGRLEKDSQLPALMLLLLVLRDVVENRLPFGFATNRGMGEVSITDVTFVGEGLDQLGFTTFQGDFAVLKEELKQQFTPEDWKKWLHNSEK